MFDDGVVAELAGVVGRLAGLPSAAGDDERVDRIAVLERVKAAAAAQLAEVAAFADSQQAANVAAGVRAGQARRGVPPPPDTTTDQPHPPRTRLHLADPDQFFYDDLVETARRGPVPCSHALRPSPEALCPATAPRRARHDEATIGSYGWLCENREVDANKLARTDAPAPSIGESRSRVLAALQDAGEALGVDEVAKRVRLHPNTVRFHLDALVEAGLVERSTEHRDQPGRPRTMYAAQPGSARAGRRSYRLLAEILSSYVGAEMPEPARAGREAGRAWGRYLAERPPPFRRLDADGATERLVGTLHDIGFAPEAATTGRDRQILLHHCPFRETASEHREIVCSIHLGLMQGILAEFGAPIDADRLDPFVEPSLCIAHLAAKQRDSEWPHDQPA